MYIIFDGKNSVTGSVRFLCFLQIYGPLFVLMDDLPLEELVVAIFLPSLDTSISYQIRGSILSEARLEPLTMTFSFALWVSTGTPLIPSPLAS